MIPGYYAPFGHKAHYFDETGRTLCGAEASLPENEERIENPRRSVICLKCWAKREQKK
jgi:hypothetical protein